MPVDHSAQPLDTAIDIATPDAWVSVRVTCPPRTRVVELSGAAAMRISYLVADAVTLDATNSVLLEASVRHTVTPSGLRVGGRNTSTTDGGPAIVLATSGVGAVSVAYRG